MIPAVKLRILHTIGKRERMHGESMARALETTPTECIEPGNEGRRETPSGGFRRSHYRLGGAVARSACMRHRRTTNDELIPVAG
jgi:hypothetical protein